MAAPPISSGLLQTEAGFDSIMQAQKRATLTVAATPHLPGGTQINSLGSLKTVSPMALSTVTVRGSVILTSPRVYIQDATGDVSIDLAHAPPLKIGDQVEATGILEPHRFSAVIRNASGRLLWQRSPAPPISVTATQAAMGLYDAMFIETEGIVESSNRGSGGESVLLLNSNHQSFRAILHAPSGNDDSNQIAPLSTVRVRGVCVVDQAYTGNLVPFAVLLRSADDLQVIASPPWWDFRNLLLIAVSLPIVAMIAFFVYLQAERWRLHAVLEERLQMAREIHDTLAQGFAAIAIQLESGIDSSRPPNRISDPNFLALQMAVRSRGEAHLSIAALRALHIDAPLGEVLQRVLKQQVEGSGLSLHVTVAGDERRLPVEIEANILRIIQESVANTMQHAKASRIDVRLDYEPDTLHLEVCDDGCGFDPQSVPGADEGHFGITGLYERAARFRASLSIFSDERRTRVSVNVPLPYPKSIQWSYLLAIALRGFNSLFPNRS